MKNTTESDAKVDALETRDFIPTQNDLVDSLPEDVLAESYKRNVGAELFDIFSDPEFQYGFNVLYPMMRDNGEI